MNSSNKTPAFIKNTLSYLQKKSVLRREKVGLRNIIRAHTGAVECQGLNVPFYLIEPSERVRLDNFHPGSIVFSAWVSYKGRRAHIRATSGQPEWINTPCDISSHFPINNLASELLRQPCTKGLQYNLDRLTIYGDSVLITDIRDHWVFRRYDMDQESFDLTDENLTTPRTTYRKNVAGHSAIYFHEMPNEDDLFYLKMRW
jgi:hypothetical protein